MLGNHILIAFFTFKKGFFLNINTLLHCTSLLHFLFSRSCPAADTLADFSL